LNSIGLLRLRAGGEWRQARPESFGSRHSRLHALTRSRVRAESGISRGRKTSARQMIDKALPARCGSR
jgi:hypothetical protein